MYFYQYSSILHSRVYTLLTFSGLQSTDSKIIYPLIEIQPQTRVSPTESPPRNQLLHDATMAMNLRNVSRQR